jgi:glyoxylase I family protein
MIELDHVTLRTAHLAATRQFFIDLFDLEEGERPVEIQQIPGHWLYSGDAPVVHLIGSYGRGTPIDGEIIDHIAFRRRGYHDFIARLKACRLPYSCMSLKGLAEHRVFLRAPGGQLIETVFRGEDARRAFDDLGLEPTYG